MVELEAIGTGILAWELVPSGKPRDANADTPVGLSRKTGGGRVGRGSRVASTLSQVPGGIFENKLRRDLTWRRRQSSTVRHCHHCGRHAALAADD